MGKHGLRIEAGLRSSADVILGLLGQAACIEAMGECLVRALRDGGKILTAGNGGSAAEACHMAEELVGRFRADRRSLPAVCLAADGTVLTCIGNDYGFDQVFSRQVEGLGRKGDVLVGFSTSGNAANLEKAFRAARAQGIPVVALLGRDGGRMAGLADIELIVADNRTERIQEAHQVVLHLVLDAVEAAFKDGEDT